MNCEHRTDDGQIARGLCPWCGELVGYTLEEKINWIIARLAA